MSRIQEILAKAERDGTASPSSTTSISGSSALAHEYVTVTVTPTLPGATTATVRTADAALHPALVAAIAPQSAAAERYRGIRARLTLHEDAGPARSILITSPAAGDGKSITAANLALTMAQEFQKNVLLVDADLRGSSIHELFGIERGPGLAELLAGEATLEDVLVYLPAHRLTLLPAGATPPFPAELLGSTAMRRVMDTLRHRFDRVLLDAPAVVPLADARTVASMVDGVMVVVRAGLTQRPALDGALVALDADKVLGVVLNDTRK
jgi:protein-tyrosine kinase